MADTIAVVTGTSRGLGLHTTVGLARKGIHVVATMRDTTRADHLLEAAADAGVTVDVRPMGLTDRDAARRCLDEVEADFGSIGILVNNAGVSGMGTLEQVDDASLQDVLDVNFLGPVALVRQVLPSMWSAGGGRIVNVTSIGGTIGEPFLDAYCASKFALEGAMQALAPVVARFGIEVAVVEPAAVVTPGLAEAVDEAARLTGLTDGPYADAAAAFRRFVESSAKTAQSPQEAAAVVVEAATTHSHRFQWQTSEAATAAVGLSLRDLDGSIVTTQMGAVVSGVT